MAMEAPLFFRLAELTAPFTGSQVTTVGSLTVHSTSSFGIRSPEVGL